MSKIISGILISLIASISWATPTAEQPDRNESVYNLEEKLGLKGYDPVSYFSEGGGAPKEGSEKITGEYGGVVYYFSSLSNKELFFSSPTKYEPTYGGWCAWAMANEGYADINPMIYTLHGNRAHFFITPGAKARFDLELIKREADADDFWKSESGEEPRI